MKWLKQQKIQKMYNAAFFKEVVHLYAEDENRNIKPKSCDLMESFWCKRLKLH